jgi:hypothetical protein
MQMPEYHSDICDSIFFYGSNRTRFVPIKENYTLPAQKACYFLYNGTRSFI